MNDILTSVIGVGGAVALNAVSSAELRGEITEWVSLIGTIAITLTTIGIQIYRLIRDRNKDKENTDKNDEGEEN